MSIEMQESNCPDCGHVVFVNPTDYSLVANLGRIMVPSYTHCTCADRHTNPTKAIKGRVVFINPIQLQGESVQDYWRRTSQDPLTEGVAEQEPSEAQENFRRFEAYCDAAPPLPDLLTEKVNDARQQQSEQVDQEWVRETANR